LFKKWYQIIYQINASRKMIRLVDVFRDVQYEAKTQMVEGFVGTPPAHKALNHPLGVIDTLHVPNEAGPWQCRICSSPALSIGVPAVFAD
jgi:hypothetical protein